MPHCTLEHSANLGAQDWQAVFAALRQALLATGEFALADIKCRALAYEHFSIGDGSGARGFVALTIEILDGRSDARKAQFADLALAALRASIADDGVAPLNLTVQIRDLHRASYRRYTSPG
jgi:5-carboxymethyl-2-hydroxymuconate isomerase